MRASPPAAVYQAPRKVGTSILRKKVADIAFEAPVQFLQCLERSGSSAPMRTAMDSV